MTVPSAESSKSGKSRDCSLEIIYFKSEKNETKITVKLHFHCSSARSVLLQNCLSLRKRCPPGLVHGPRTLPHSDISDERSLEPRANRGRWRSSPMKSLLRSLTDSTALSWSIDPSGPCVAMSLGIGNEEPVFTWSKVNSPRIFARVKWSNRYIDTEATIFRSSHLQSASIVARWSNLNSLSSFVLEAFLGKYTAELKLQPCSHHEKTMVSTNSIPPVCSQSRCLLQWHGYPTRWHGSVEGRWSTRNHSRSDGLFRVPLPLLSRWIWSIDRWSKLFGVRLAYCSRVTKEKNYCR